MNSTTPLPCTHFLRDILRQPTELQRAIAHLTGAGSSSLEDAAAIVKRHRRVFLTGIGASWHAALSAGALFGVNGTPVYLQEAGELLHFTAIPPDSVVIAISRTGLSIEIVQLLAKVRESRSSMIGITNSADGPLAKGSEVAIVIPTPLDFAISVNTYSTLVLAALALAHVATDSPAPFSALSTALTQVENCLVGWQEKVAAAEWLETGARYCFLGRGTGQASGYQARLLWEEGAKSSATAMNTSGFRHGPQEAVFPGMRFGIFVDAVIMRAQDLAVADDLHTLGAAVMLIGQHLPKHSRHLILDLPELPQNWQSVVEIIPMQIAAEQLARLSGVDCDSFRVCSYIVEDEHGLLKNR